MGEIEGNEVDRVLTSKQVDEFHKRGVLVVRSFLNNDEVVEARKGKRSLLVFMLS